MNRKIDTWTIGAFNSGAGVYSCHNRVVRVMDDGARVVELHGFRVAHITSEKRVFFSLAGWNSDLTRRTLNSIFETIGAGVVCSRGDIPYYDNTPLNKSKVYEIKNGCAIESAWID